MDLPRLRHNKSLEDHISPSEKSFGEVAKLCEQTQKVKEETIIPSETVYAYALGRLKGAILPISVLRAARTIRGWRCFVEPETLSRR